MPESVFTQTIPAAGGPWSAGALCVDAAGAARAGGAVAAGAGAGAGEEEFDAEEGGAEYERAGAALPTVTSGVILPTVDAETPAFDRSLTEE